MILPYRAPITIEILGKISQNSKKNDSEIFTRLYRYLLRSDIYFIAYQRLYKNNGAATKDVDNDTADGFSEGKVQKIIQSLRDETYQPKPVRRTYRDKPNGGKRPLGIPTFTDKLVQEVLRMILETTYEPTFLNESHGFRPIRSCHTALSQAKREFIAVRWFIEGDIKGCFDNIDHKTLINFINAKIKDAKFLKLLYKFLKAEYLEDWKYNKTYSGTPQGGIISPILSNIYMHELDLFIKKMAIQFNKPAKQYQTDEYKAKKLELMGIRYYFGKAEGLERENLLKEMKKCRQELLKIPVKLQTDKKIKYIRYADDFLIGVNGSKEDCEQIKKELTEFLRENLKLELSQEKTLITHSNTEVRFLGYNIKVRRNQEVFKVKGPTKNYIKRKLNNMVALSVPLKEKINKFLFDKGAVNQKEGKISSCGRQNLKTLSDLEILSTFNSELRGLCNYYGLAVNFCRLSYFAYMMEYSCLKTIASRHDTSIAKIRSKYQMEKGRWAIPYEVKTGKKFLYFARYQDCKESKNPEDLIPNKAIQHQAARSSFEDRLKSKDCELCKNANADYYEIHHVNKLKNLKGKSLWERTMIAKNRKTMVLCRDCHKKIHKK